MNAELIDLVDGSVAWRPTASDLQVGVPTADFWSVWRDHKEELKQLGIMVRKDEFGRYYVLRPRPLEIAAWSAGEQQRFEDVKKYLRAWQSDAVQRLVTAVKTYGAALDASETGTGKTYVALAVACVLQPPRVAVVCPKSLVPVWRDVAEKHFKLAPERLIVDSYERFRRGGVMEAVVVDDTDSFSWVLPERSMIIFDEAHRLKSYKSLQNKMAMAALDRDRYHILALSATVADTPLDMKFIGRALRLYHRSFWSWARELGVRKNQWGGWEFHGGYDVLQRLHSDIFRPANLPSRGVRLLRDQIPGFPKTQIDIAAVDADGAVGIYNRLLEQLRALRRQAASNAPQEVLAVTEILKARQAIEEAKLPALAEMIEDALQEDVSVAVFLNFQSSIALLSTKLQSAGIEHCKITGDTPSLERQVIIDDFQHDRLRTVLLTLPVGGVGISLHGARFRLALLSPTWSAQDFVQALGRVHRDGGGSSLQRIVVARDTLEERVARTLGTKLKNTAAIVDDDLRPELDIFRSLVP